ncbi:arginase family protein, partial [Clavibacter michiganensis subsp. insidiosus]
MPASFVVVPQWQGSGSSRAMRLADGAEAIRGDLPASATHVVDVPVEAGESLGTGVLRY